MLGLRARGRAANSSLLDPRRIGAHTRMASAVHFSETFDRDNGSCRKRLKLLESDQCLLDTLERNLEVQFVSNSASLVILASSTGCCCCQATLQIQSYVHRLKPSR